MSEYIVGITVGRLTATVEAASAADAIDAAIRQWETDAGDLFAAATFDVRKSDD